MGRTKALSALFAALILSLAWLCLPRGSRGRRKLERWFHCLILAGHGLKVRMHGKPSLSAGTLFVANHISWIDIPLLASLLDAAFVAKDDIARWPLIGTLARRCGTLFIARDRPRSIDSQRQLVSTGLAADRGVILFPEGTTSDGKCLLPFRSSLFAVTGTAAAVTQPVAIVYGRQDGGSLCEAERRAITWIGDDALLPHALTLASMGGLAVDVYFDPPIIETNRKLLAEACRQAIRTRLRPDNQAATLNRVA